MENFYYDNVAWYYHMTTPPEGGKEVLSCTNGQWVYTYDGEFWRKVPSKIPASPPDRVKRTLELQFWKTKELEPFECRDNWCVYQLSNPTFEGFTTRYRSTTTDTGMWSEKEVKSLYNAAHTALSKNHQVSKYITKWHRENYKPAPDEAYGPVCPFKMEANQVRSHTGRVVNMTVSDGYIHFNMKGSNFFSLWVNDVLAGKKRIGVEDEETHPWNDLEQRERIKRFAADWILQNSTHLPSMKVRSSPTADHEVYSDVAGTIAGVEYAPGGKPMLRIALNAKMGDHELSLLLNKKVNVRTFTGVNTTISRVRGQRIVDADLSSVEKRVVEGIYGKEEDTTNHLFGYVSKDTHMGRARELSVRLDDGQQAGRTEDARVCVTILPKT